MYLLLTGRIARLWRVPGYALAGLVVLAGIAAFLGAREAASPGYVAAAWANDVGGRFGALRDAVPQRPDFYLRQLWAGYFAATLPLLLSPLALWRCRGGTGLVLGYALVISIVMLALVSAAATRLHHYILPALPFMAIAAAIALREIVRWALRARTSGPRDRVIAGALIAIAAFSLVSAVESAVARRYLVLATSEGARSGRYGALLATLARGTPRPIVVVDPGFANQGAPHYAPVLRAYRLIWAARGVVIGHVTDPSHIAALHGIVASCDAGIVPLLRARGRDVAGLPDCAAIRQP